MVHDAHGTWLSAMKVALIHRSTLLFLNTIKNDPILFFSNRSATIAFMPAVHRDTTNLQESRGRPASSVRGQTLVSKKQNKSRRVLRGPRPLEEKTWSTHSEPGQSRALTQN
jgi:hypothetical protein